MSFSRLSKSVFLVNCDNLSLDWTLPHQLQPSNGSRGSAFLLHFLERPWLVTCHHVVAAAQHIQVTLSGQGMSKAQSVKLVAACPLLDLAVLAFEDEPPAKVTLKPDLPPKSIKKALPGPEPGLTSFAAGFPLGQTHLKITKGIINGQQNGFLQTDTPINPGNSGGPLLCKGRVVGISAQGLDRASSVGWAIPVVYLLNFLRFLSIGKLDLERPRFVQFPRSWGMEWLHRDDLLLLSAREKTTCGVRVHAVYPYSFASRAGVLPGDLWLKIQGRSIDGSGRVALSWLRQPVSLQIFLYHQALGRKLLLDMVRNGQLMRLSAEFRPESPKIAFSLCLWPAHCPTPHLYFAGLVLMNMTPQLMSALSPGSTASAISDILDGAARHESDLERSHVSDLDPSFLRPLRERFWAQGHVVVTHLLAGSLAQKHTVFKVGDILKSCNDAPIRSIRGLQKTLASLLSEAPVTLTVEMRSGRRAVLNLRQLLEEEAVLSKLHGYRSFLIGKSRKKGDDRERDVLSETPSS